MEKVTLAVIQGPVEVRYNCPNCNEFQKYSFREFASIVGDPCDWEGDLLTCFNCDADFRIDKVDWNN